MVKFIVYQNKMLNQYALNKDRFQIPLLYSMLNFRVELRLSGVKENFYLSERELYPNNISNLRTITYNSIFIDRFPLLKKILGSFIINGIKSPSHSYRMFYMISFENYFLNSILRLLHPGAQSILKTCIDERTIKHLMESKNTSFKRNYLLNNLNSFDIITVESDYFKEMLSYIFPKLKPKLKVLWNCYPMSFKLFNKPRFQDKEKTILHVGRLGSYQKNSELFLESLSNDLLKDFRVVMIGEYTDEFYDLVYDRFNYEISQEKLLMTGAIPQNELIKYYRKASYLIITSRWESFPHVLPESLYFGIYVISTEIGLDSSLVRNNLVTIVEDSILIKKLSEIIKVINYNELTFKNTINYSLNYSWENCLPKILENKI